MDAPPDLAAQAAAEALMVIGFPVEPYGPDMDVWLLGGLIWTDAELMGLAARQGVQGQDDRLQ